jgi:pimeloyl-ACP methyl ester carboxylesterase
MLFFHGNAEDIGLTYELIDHMRSSFKINILAVEYPDYGIYKDPEGCGEQKILEDSEDVMDYVLNTTGLLYEDIILFGRSMGSGPACHLASRSNVAALMIMSGYTSIKEVARHKVGRFLASFVKERFENLKILPRVMCPTFIVHGQKDSLIPIS